MALGILEDHSPLSHVPGTALLEVDDNVQQKNVTHLKKGTGKNSHVVLVPQPSDDPNDPLNWPLWQRDLLLCLYCYCTLLCIGGLVRSFPKWSSHAHYVAELVPSCLPLP